jgi:hypothetical protein
MYIDDAVNSHSTKSKKPLAIHALAEKFADKTAVVTNFDFNVEEIEALRPRQIEIEK